MLTLDQVRRELKAIEEFDAIFLKNPPTHADELIGVLMRHTRRQELRMFAEVLAENN